MARKICVVTGTRAEYGLLYWLLRAIQTDPNLELMLLVTGMHLSPEFGMTVEAIERDGFPISKRIEVLLSSDTGVGIGKSVGLGTISFSEAFAELRPDVIVILGDRFEMLAVATAATFAQIPIAHIHGGETTEGAFDEAIRHCLTKMSHLHFASTPDYRRRIIQLGEQPERVFWMGALGIENIRRLELLSRDDLSAQLDIDLSQGPVFTITFHPSTLDPQPPEQQFQQLLEALEEFPEARLVFTKPNADTGGRALIRMLDEYVTRNLSRARGFASLGQLRYLSLLHISDVLIGNSSSGIIEAPSLACPSIDIGLRQKGRVKAVSTISCVPVCQKIVQAIQKANSSEFKALSRRTDNPYDRGAASFKIVEVLKNADFSKILQKTFYDLPETIAQK